MTKTQALGALAKRRAANKDRTRVDNSKLYAGSPMFFYCLTCDTEIIVPESYTSRPKLCGDCQNLKALGWLE